MKWTAIWSLSYRTLLQKMADKNGVFARLCVSNFLDSSTLHGKKSSYEFTYICYLRVFNLYRRVSLVYLNVQKKNV